MFLTIFLLFLLCQSGNAEAQFTPSAWPQDTGSPVNSSPVLGDIDRDGILEIIVGSDNNKVYAWKPDGTLMPGWPVTTGDSVRSSPALADLNGDGYLDIIVGSFDNKVYAWNFHGSLLPGWPAVTGSVIYSSPAVGDIDGDQLPEVVVGSFDNKVYAWNADGTLVRGWPKPTGLFVYSSPALADLDKDGVVEVIVGTDNHRVFAWKGDGTDVDGWPTATEHVVPSSPAVGDLDNDGELEVVVGSWDKVFVWNRYGERKAGWPVTAGHQIPSSPALADLTNDGQLEVIIGCKDGKVYAWNARGQIIPGWPTVTDAEISGSPVVGDLDGDGVLEVVIGSKDSKVYAWGTDGRLLPGWPKSTGGEISASPAIGDIDRNGTIELIVASKDNHVYAWNIERYGSGMPKTVWQSFRGNPQHSGLYGDFEQGMVLAASSSGPSSINVISQPPEQVGIQLSATPQQPKIIKAGPVSRNLPPETGKIEGYVADLTVIEYTSDSVTLRWTAPLGAYTPEARYEIRFAPEPITEDNWGTALPYHVAIPLATAGGRELYRLEDLELSTTQPFFAALKIVDKLANTISPVSPLSNVARLIPVDNTPPDKVQNLQVVELNETILELSWIAPGGDGAQGTAAKYDLRFAEVPLNETSWMRATQIGNLPAPLPSGMEQKIQVPKPWDDREIFWGLKVIDDSLNISAMSNEAVWNPKDAVLPSRVVDLRVLEHAENSVTLTWTAPGDNRNVGQAQRYDLRYADLPLTEADWDSATPVSDQILPQMAGSTESYTLRDIPPAKRVFVGVKTIDSSGNISVLSNVVEAKSADITPPPVVSDLQLEDVGRDWIAVSWTAQSDGEQQQIASYVLRYGGNLRVLKSWQNAVDAEELPTPSQPGATERATIKGLDENSIYYIGLRVLDAQGNSSETSNILRAKTIERLAPNAIGDLIVEEVRADGVTLNWTAPKQHIDGKIVGVKGYDVRYSLIPITEESWETASRLQAMPSPSSPESLETFTVKEGPKDSAYYLALKSYGELGKNSNLSNVIQIPKVDIVPPAPIIDLFVERAEQDSVTISWTAAGDDESRGQAAAQLIRIAPDLTQIKQWDQAQDVENSLLPSVAGSKDSYSIRGLQSNSTYYIAVKSLDAFGNESEMSNIVRAKTKDVLAPASIVDLQGIETETDSVVLEWTAPGENGMEGQAKSYDIRYSQGPISPANWNATPPIPLVPAPEPAGTSQSLRVTGLSPNTKYYFAITATDSSGNTSSLSNQLEVLTTDTVAPGVITTLQAENIDSSSVFLSWISPGDDDLHTVPAGYEVRYSDRPLTEAKWNDARIAGDSPRPSPEGEEERFLLSGLHANTLYYIAVRTLDTGGNISPLSNIVRVYSSDNFITDLKISDFSDVQVTLTWTTPGGVFSQGTLKYDIRYSVSKITDDTWDKARSVSPYVQDDLSVKRPGSAERIRLRSLPIYEQIFLAVKLAAESGMDEASQKSALSNVVELKRTDTMPPADVADLVVRDLGDTANGMRNLQLSWTAPGDNDFDGTATKYEIRYGSVSPTEENWERLTLFNNIPTPLLSGTYQQVDVQVPSAEETVYFAMRSIDENFNMSNVSNSAQWSPEDTFPPARIADLKAERQANGGIKLSWTAPGDNEDRGTAHIYDIRFAEKESDLKKWNKATVVPDKNNPLDEHEPLPAPAGTVQGYTIIGLRKDRSYYIAMTATDDVKNTSEVSNIAVIEKVPPQEISDLAFVGGTETNVTLSWTAPQDRVAERVVSYEVRYAESPERLEQWKRAKKVKHSLVPREFGKPESITIEKLKPNMRYYFGLKALDHSKELSEMSNVAIANTTDTIPPQALNSVNVTLADEHSLALSWTVVPDDAMHDRPEYYEIRYSLDPLHEGNWDNASPASGELPSDSPGSLMEYTVSGLQENTRYHVAVRAIDAAGNISPLSNMLAARTQDVTPPDVIADLKAIYPTSSSVMLRWTCPADATGSSSRTASEQMIIASELPEEESLIGAYDIRYMKMPPGGEALHGFSWDGAEKVQIPPTPLVPGSTEDFVVRNLIPNQSYYFAIRSLDQSGNMSDISNFVLETTFPADDLVAQARAISSSEASGWKLVQGAGFGELSQDTTGTISLQKTREVRGVTNAAAITAVYPSKVEKLMLRQGELRFEVKGTSSFSMCARVMASDSGEPYYLCYTAEEQPQTAASRKIEVLKATDPPATVDASRKRIENYVFYALDPALLDGEWHEVRRDLPRDLLDGTGHSYRQATRFAIRGENIALRKITVKGSVFTPITNFEDGLPPLQTGWKLHFGNGSVQLAQESFASDTREVGSARRDELLDGVVIAGIRPRSTELNTYLSAKSNSGSGIVVTYPKSGIGELSSKPFFVATMKVGPEFKLILKVRTKDLKEYYLAYLPESSNQTNPQGTSGNYIYLPLHTRSSGDGWTLIQANIDEDLRRYNLEYAYTTWLSFHGTSIGIDNIGFSTDVLEAILQ
ncbi:MAG: hypothetical protein GY801_02490 [bacterium]|nr:hypothetical protein [bacterium]